MRTGRRFYGFFYMSSKINHMLNITEENTLKLGNLFNPPTGPVAQMKTLYKKLKLL